MAGTFIGEPWKQPYTAQQLQDAATHQVPIIGANGNFWRWDIATSAYVDTGVLAGAGLPDGSVTTPKLADGAVTWPKLAPEARKANDNLLDNAYFIGGGSQQGGGQFPINQRGLTEYLDNGYTIDRWRNGNTTLRIRAGYITLGLQASGTVYSYLQQVLEPSTAKTLAGQTVTFSILARGTVTGARIHLYTNPNANIGNGLTFAPTDEWAIYSFSVTLPSDFAPTDFWALIYPNTGGGQGELDIMAAKLELGPYQTLAYESAGGGVETKQSPQLQR